MVKKFYLHMAFHHLGFSFRIFDHAAEKPRKFHAQRFTDLTVFNDSHMIEFAILLIIKENEVSGSR